MQQWICAEQIHGSAIRKVDEGEAGNGSLDMNSAIPGTDGLYTNAKGILLALAYADCVPLYFFAPRSGFVGIAHAGWRGTVQNIGGLMVERWVRNQSIPIEDIHVAIGPSIGPCCYEVDYRVIEAVGEALEPDVDQVCRPVGESHFHLDLKACNRILLKNAGISESRIECSSYCTGCRTDKFYSHRKENGKTGRMLGFIGLPALA
jgi:YfiH family protein